MTTSLRGLAAIVAAMAIFAPAGAAWAGDAAPVTIAIDAQSGRHPISPLIYGVSFATTAVLTDLNLPLNRSGGDSASLYNWRLDARNAGKDWFFESLPCGADIFDQHGEGFVALTKAAGAQPMLTVPMIGWVAKLGPDRTPLASFSIGKYGLQDNSDQSGLAEAGNGLTLDGAPIGTNDPTDAAMPDGPDDERPWIEHLVARFGRADSGGLKYYIMDNEPGMWHIIHRDVHPDGIHARDLADKVKTYAAMVKSVDPHALVVAPESWGWTGYRYSGFDQQYAVQHGFDAAPDRATQTGGQDLLPWLLSQWKAAGHPVDVVSVHFYPQDGVYSDSGDDMSVKTQVLRNRSTRDLWDWGYKDPTWINDTVALIPRLRRWVDTYYYPGTPIALTEYNWGAEAFMSGATAQADVWGIFGREGLDMAARWAAPAPGSPTYLAMMLYRNYDGHKSTFGDVSVSAAAPDPDTVAAFAAERSGDGALTVVVINKRLDQASPVRLALSHFFPQGRLETYQLASGVLRALPAASFAQGAVTAVLPAQSVTLFVLQGTSP